MAKCETFGEGIIYKFGVAACFRTAVAPSRASSARKKEAEKSAGRSCVGIKREVGNVVEGKHKSSIRDSAAPGEAV